MPEQRLMLWLARLLLAVLVEKKTTKGAEETLLVGLLLVLPLLVLLRIPRSSAMLLGAVAHRPAAGMLLALILLDRHDMHQGLPRYVGTAMPPPPPRWCWRSNASGTLRRCRAYGRSLVAWTLRDCAAALAMHLHPPIE